MAEHVPATIDPRKYIAGTFAPLDAPLDAPVGISLEDEGSWAVITYGTVETTRDLLHTPKGTRGYLLLDVGDAMFVLFDDRDCNIEIIQIPLADVLAPELSIVRRHTHVAAERVRLQKRLKEEGHHERLELLRKCANEQPCLLTL